MIKKGWGDPERLNIVDISLNTFLFNFTNHETPSRILKESPWNILGQALVLQEWDPQAPIQEIEFKHIPFWIQIHGLPLELFSKQNDVRAGSKIGEVMEVEEPFNGTSINRGFLRARVLVNINNPLVVSFWIQRAALPSVWVKIRYKMLMDFCYNYGRLGHEHRSCKQSKAMEESNDPSKPLYGPWIGVPPLKGLES